MTITVREVQETDERVWRNLWAGYLDFYESPEIGERADALWNQLLDADSPFQCRVAVEDGSVVGLVHFFQHPDTWFARPTCHLADLFVDPSVRGGGAGRALIDVVRAYVADNQLSGLYWHTQATNHTARALYDDITGGTNGHVVYELPGVQLAGPGE